MARQAKRAGSPKTTSRAPKRAPSSKASNTKASREARDSGLESITARLVNLAAERKSLGEDMSDIYADAKDRGFDIKVLRRTVKVLGETAEQRSERERVESESDDMLHALGALHDTPLGAAAQRAAEGRSPPPKAAPVEPPAPTTEPPHAIQ
jgi:uncharacterized protein (UPF0335 family)